MIRQLAASLFLTLAILSGMALLAHYIDKWLWDKHRLVWRKLMNIRRRVMDWMPLVTVLVLIYVLVYFRLYG